MKFLTLVALLGVTAAAEDVSACKLPADQNVYLSVGFGYELDCAPSVGTMKTFMIFVDFPDQAANDTTQSLYDVFIPGGPEWFKTASFGKLDLTVEADLSTFYRMPAESSSYGWQRGLTSEAHQKYIQDALEVYTAAGNTVEPVDILYIVPTSSASEISFSPTFMGEVTTREGVPVAKKAVTFGLDAFSTWHYKVLNHETGHTMCLPDLYPLPTGPTGLYVGGWDLEGYINGPSPDYFAWNKWRLGWLNDDQIDCITGAGSTTHTLSPVEVLSADGATTGKKAVVVRHNATSALVAEVRTGLANDEDACAEGVLLYQISTTRETGTGSIVVLDANPNSGGCAGEELSDAPLSLTSGGASSYTAEDWGVKVAVVSQDGNEYKISVEVS